MKAEEYFKKEYGEQHIDLVVDLNDTESLYKLIDEYVEKEIKELKDDIEKIRMITYATFGEGWTYENATYEQKKIANIDKIIYPKYYNSENNENPTSK